MALTSKQTHSIVDAVLKMNKAGKRINLPKPKGKQPKPLAKPDSKPAKDEPAA